MEMAEENDGIKDGNSATRVKQAVKLLVDPCRQQHIRKTLPFGMLQVNRYAHVLVVSFHALSKPDQALQEPIY
jgi:hypothetical protein